MTKYPADEFDEVPISVDRQGVHRERLMPDRSSGLALKILVGVLALLVGLAAYFLLPRLGLEAGPSGSTASAADASGIPTPDSDPAEAGSGESASTFPAPAPGEASPGAVDRSQGLNVLNATGTVGLATTAAGRLAAEGWSGAIAGNWAGPPVQASTVFYGGADQQPAAQELAADLGIATVMASPDAAPLITAVLGPDFR
ncbi:hypothetical protein IWX65_001234 [Arthrobacter sp. CAN_A214]|uniref:LytR C-terminal domain-containing protein n=1 Tax=Arthrobacter sp. CAN_A214 TaxID=2787720 RepID=UPI0018CAB365